MADLQKLVVKLEAENRDLKKGLKNSEKELKGFGNSVKKIGGLIAGAFAVGAIVEFGKEAFKLSEQFNGINKAFATLRNSKSLLVDLKEATGGAVSEMRLMQMAVQAVNLGISQNQLAKFFEFATIRAAETGESVDYLVNSIVTGVGRGSIMILDNLGISAQQLGEGFASAGDKAERVAKVIDGQLAKSNVTIEDAATGTDKFAASWDNLKVAVGNFINSNTAKDALSFFAKMIDGVRSFVEAISFTKATALADLKELQKNLIKFQDTARRIGDVKSFIDVTAQLEIVNEKIFKLTRNTDKAEKETKQLASATRELTEEQKELARIRSQISGGGEVAGLGAQALPTEGLDNMSMKLQGVKQQTIDFAANLEKLGLIAIDVEAALEGLVSNTLVGFAESIGNAIAGVGNFGDSILVAVANFVKQFGVMLIEAGTAAAIAQQMLITNPYAAIAAGIALVAIGAAFAASAQKAASNMGSAGGGSSGGGRPASRGGSSLSGGGMDVIKIVGEIKGQDLIFVQEKAQRNKGFRG